MRSQTSGQRQYENDKKRHQRRRAAADSLSLHICRVHVLRESDTIIVSIVCLAVLAQERSPDDELVACVEGEVVRRYEVERAGAKTK